MRIKTIKRGKPGGRKIAATYWERLQRELEAEQGTAASPVDIAVQEVMAWTRIGRNKGTLRPLLDKLFNAGLACGQRRHKAWGKLNSNS